MAGDIRELAQDSFALFHEAYKERLEWFAEQEAVARAIPVREALAKSKDCLNAAMHGHVDLTETVTGLQRTLAEGHDALRRDDEADARNFDAQETSDLNLQALLISVRKASLQGNAIRGQMLEIYGASTQLIFIAHVLALTRSLTVRKAREADEMIKRLSPALAELAVDLAGVTLGPLAALGKAIKSVFFYDVPRDSDAFESANTLFDRLDALEQEWLTLAGRQAATQEAVKQMDASIRSTFD